MGWWNKIARENKGYEQHCPKCEGLMSYEKCAGFVLLVCSCGHKYVLEDTTCKDYLQVRKGE